MDTLQSYTIPKPQFGPWLIEQVESGAYKGLWKTGDDTFRIPWKHNSRRDLSDEDVKIFKEWAVASGKIMDHPNDKAKWKTNFRCALSGHKNFEMLEDHSKDSEDQHKIYRIKYSQNIHENREPCPVDPIPLITSIYKPENYITQDIERQLLDQVVSMDLNQHSESQPMENWDQSNIQYNYFGDNYSGVHTDPAAPMQQAYCTDNLPALCDMEISINYRKTEVLNTRLCSPLIQFHYQCDPRELRGESIRFPCTKGLKDQKQIKYTKRILDSIERGLLLEVNQSGIYGFRQDNCKVFVSTADAAEIQNPEPRKLHQYLKEPLLSFEKFQRDLKNFMENKGGSPDYTIYLCFGEKPNDGKPLEKKLITVKIVPLICRELHERAQQEGASSLQNISLQLSNNSLFDLINSMGLPSV